MILPIRRPGCRKGHSLRLLSAVTLVSLATTAATTPVHALVWPDVAERVERDLAAADAATRLAAARQIASLGPARGPALALVALNDEDDDVRLAAADAAIRLHAAGATDDVVPWLNAPNVRLRREACEVARALPSPRAVAPLARTLGDPDAEVRVAAAEALGHQAAAEAVAPLLGRLDDASPTVRIAIVAALARLGDARAVVPLLGKVEDSAPDVRQAVARALGELDDPRASAALVPALRDQNPDVRREALIALGRLRAADAVDAIAPFATDRAAALQLAALEALGRIATPDALRVLLGALGTADDTSPGVERTPVRDALVAAGAPAIPLLRAVLAGSPSPAMAASAAFVLGELHAHAEAPTITVAMRRGILPTAAALHALAGAGTTAEVPVVLEFLTDPSPLVRARALQATVALLDPHQPDGRAVEPLAAALRDPRPTAAERAQLATLLGRTGAPRAAPLLAELTSAHDHGLQIAAIDALGTLGPAGADQALLDALRSRDAEMRLHAAVALASAGGDRAREALLGALADGDEVDRPALLTALGGVLARAPTDDAVARLRSALELAAGPERDAILEAVGRAPLATAVRVLATAAQSPEPLDRRAAAVLSAAHPGDAVAEGIAMALIAGPRPQRPRPSRLVAWLFGRSRCGAVPGGHDTEARERRSGQRDRRDRAHRRASQGAGGGSAIALSARARRPRRSPRECARRTRARGRPQPAAPRRGERNATARARSARRSASGRRVGRCPRPGPYRPARARPLRAHGCVELRRGAMSIAKRASGTRGRRPRLCRPPRSDVAATASGLHPTDGRRPSAFG